MTLVFPRGAVKTPERDLIGQPNPESAGRRRRVAIVGGGISGLAAAWHLQHWGADELELSLFEAAPRLGGVIDTLELPGRLIELGADNFATLDPTAWQWCQAMGLEQELVGPATEHRGAMVAIGQRVLPIPEGFVLLQPGPAAKLLRSPLLSWPGKLRLMCEPWIPTRRDPSDESLQSFATRRLGRECFERLVEPLVAGIFTAQAETLSMQAALPRFVELENRWGSLTRAAINQRRQPARRRSASPADPSNTPPAGHRSLGDDRGSDRGARYAQFVAPRLGMRWWINQIAHQLDRVQRLQQTIERLERTRDGRWQLHAREPTGAAQPIWDAVCLAVPAGVAASLLRSLDQSLAEQLAAIPYASSAVAAMIVRADEVPPDRRCFGIVIPRVEGRPVLAISCTSRKYPGRVPDGELLLRVFIGGAIAPDLLREPDQKLFDIAWQQAKELLHLTTPPIWQQLIRWPHAMPQYLLGHAQRVAAIEQELTRWPGLTLAGNAYRGVGIPQCVASGRRAAAHILQHLGLKAPAE
jgi:protoporphyrinogen/coproporphyrinogen III oxidase